MANSDTLGHFDKEQMELIRRAFGEPEVDESMPDGYVRLTEEKKTEVLPVDEFLSRAERLALAKELREKRPGPERAPDLPPGRRRA